jgi:hypothetical protein
MDKETLARMRSNIDQANAKLAEIGKQSPLELAETYSAAHWLSIAPSSCLRTVGWLAMMSIGEIMVQGAQSEN